MSALDKCLKKLYDFSRQNIAYRIYEKHLLKQIIQYPFPKHIGIILDGNRRWSKIKEVKKRERSQDWCRHCRRSFELDLRFRNKNNHRLCAVR
jgi:undecaprenyl pyrophosphate synthase